jgi:hypothetical protein
MKSRRRTRFTAFEPASTHTELPELLHDSAKARGTGNIGVAGSVVERDGND